MRKLRDRVVFCVAVVLVIGCSGSTGPSKPAGTTSAVLSIDTVTAFPGQSVSISLRLTQTEGDGPRLDSLGGFEFLINYDKSVLAFMSYVSKGPAISNWEYFTYRAGGKMPCMSCNLEALRIVAQRDLNDGAEPDSGQYAPEGILATLRFLVSSDRSRIGTVAEVGFGLLECRDNTIYLEGNRNSLYMPDTRIGRISFMTGYDTMACPRAYTLHPTLELRGGWIRIEEPRPGQRGDIDLNGAAFEVQDAVLFSSFFRSGYSVLDPLMASQQIAATDCDGDGEPLTRTDLGVMIRTISGEDPIGDSLSVPYMDTLLIRPRHEGDRWILSFESTIQLDELWLKIEEPGLRRFYIRSLGDSPPTVSLSSLHDTVQVACGTVDGKQLFGPELGDRFEIKTDTGELDIVAAQASRYPGVSMTVRVKRPFNGADQMVTVGEMAK